LLCVMLLVAGCATTATKPAVLSGPVSPVSPAPPPPPPPKRADFENQPSSGDTQHVADWVVDSGDSHGMPFMIIDKTYATVYMFEPEGHLLAEAPCLIGLTKGDVCDPGIGREKLSQMVPSQRITPAGRFVASLGPDLKGKIVLWVDYNGGLGLHWVATGNPKEHRLERIASPNPADHRISYGCINVPNSFYQDVVKPTFTGKKGVVYILPEVQSNSETFKSYYRVELKGKSATR
ncbi:MAG: hypothetical protein P4L55_05870, partial [Syntrophobacteraceae bacterium]|nr:hypothetical protein [Syntrophobacteraceae bacterium]